MPRSTPCESSTPVAITGRQKMVLMLEKGNYSHARIAAIMGISRQAVTQLLARAHAAEKALHTAVQDFITAA